MPTRAGDAWGFRQIRGGAFYGKANSAAAAVTEIVLIAFAELGAKTRYNTNGVKY